MPVARHSGPCLRFISFGSGSGCVPLAIPPDQNYNSQAAPYVTLRAIAFNSHRENLLTAFPAFTLLCTHSQKTPSLEGGLTVALNPITVIQKTLFDYVLIVTYA